MIATTQAKKVVLPQPARPTAAEVVTKKKEQFEQVWQAHGYQLDLLAKKIAEQLKETATVRQRQDVATLATYVLDSETLLRIATKDLEKYTCPCCGKPFIWYKEPKMKRLWAVECPRSFYMRVWRNKNMGRILTQIGVVDSPQSLIERIVATQKGQNGQSN